MADEEERTVSGAEMLDALPCAIVVVSRDGWVALSNASATKLLGYPSGELRDLPLETIIPGGLDAYGRWSSARMRGEGHITPLAQWARARCRDGTEVDVELEFGKLGPDDSGLAILAMRELKIDRSESAKLSTEDMFRDLLESAPDAMVIVDQSGRIVLVNSQVEKLFRRPRSEVLGKSVEVLIPDRFRGRHVGHRSVYFREPGVRAMGSALELLGLRGDGTEFPVEVSLSPLETPEGLLVSSAIRDVTERKSAEEARGHLAAIVNSSHDAIMGLSLEGLITSWNSGAELVFGYESAEVLGRSVALLSKGEHGGGEADCDELNLIHRLIDGQGAQTFETTRRRKNGDMIDVSVTLSPVLDTKGQLVGASKAARDISERKQAEMEVYRALEAMEVANRELEAFSYSVAHDLRAPLRGIDGFSQALLSGHADQLDDEGKRYLRRVRESAQRMGSLIEDLLSLAQITRAETRRESVDLSALAKKILARLHAGDPNRHVETRVEDGLVVPGDSRLLAVALDNLLQNAWKFTRNEACTRIEFFRQVEGRRQIYCVKDNGAGFDMAYASKLFGVFQRLHTTREFEGTGIGLATVARIIQRHGGNIWAEGQVSHGATFFFTIDEK